MIINVDLVLRLFLLELAVIDVKYSIVRLFFGQWRWLFLWSLWFFWRWRWRSGWFFWRWRWRSGWFFWRF
jgi:hypothetical protein